MENKINAWFKKIKLEELRDEITNSNSNRNVVLGKELLNGDDPIQGIELIRAEAINGNIDAIYHMAYLCHDNYMSLETQNRKQEEFWYQQIVDAIKERKILSHAQNMTGSSYDHGCSEEKRNEALMIAAAKGDQRAIEILAIYYANKIEDPVSLKKSLCWFYSLDNMSVKTKEKLSEVEELLGLSK